ncbi:MAG: hypothetical protein HDT23_00490 [Ruminococcus sp.]|nr:hypothetical protein [Ruminococcus sp.]
MAGNNQNNQVEPYSLGKVIVIVAVLTLLDTVGCIVLVVGAYIFTKKGHAGLGMALAVTNIFAPDALPAVDEIFGIIAVVVPYMKSREDGKSVGESIKASVDSAQQYARKSDNYIQKSEKVAEKIGVPRNQEINYDSDSYNDNYYDES